MIDILPKVDELLEANASLDKLATLTKGKLADAIAPHKLLIANQLFDHAKTAGFMPPLRTLGKATLWGTGLTVPATAGGSILINQLTEAAKDKHASMRNNILQTALGLAVLGGGAYGLYKLLGDKGTAKTGAALPMTKMAEEYKTADEKITGQLFKLATVGALEQILETAQKKAGGATLEKIATLRVMNRLHGLALLQESFSGL